MHVMPAAITVIAGVYALSIACLAVLFGRALWRERGLPLPEPMDLSSKDAQPAPVRVETAHEVAADPNTVASGGQVHLVAEIPQIEGLAS